MLRMGDLSFLFRPVLVPACAPSGAGWQSRPVDRRPNVVGQGSEKCLQISRANSKDFWGNKESSRRSQGSGNRHVGPPKKRYILLISTFVVE